MPRASKVRNLFANSRFWILAASAVMSVNIAGFIQLEIPAGSLQTIRIEQTYGFVSLLLLYTAILASPLTKVFPNLPFKAAYLHARRAIGVSAFYYAFLHVYITFFKQLNGFSGIKYLNHQYSLSLLFGVFALGVLFVMAATSMDWVVDMMSFKRWKLLHRLVYFASVAVLLHVIIIGPHYLHLSLLGILTYLAAAVLIGLEILRIRLNWRKRSAK
jgi:DMSO/TMAO reductase YedYZ heme-binding membrane subunit